MCQGWPVGVVNSGSSIPSTTGRGGANVFLGGAHMSPKHVNIVFYTC